MKEVKANQDIRDYMEDHGVTQRELAAEVGVSQWTICTELKTELSQKNKEMYLTVIDGIVAGRHGNPSAEEPAETAKVVEATTKFQIGDRVKISSKQNVVGVVSDIWSSMAQDRTMYEVTSEGGIKGLYAEKQLEPAPLPIDYSFESHIDGNVAVVTMMATQGEKTWVFARGHAHILHDGEVGMAQAVSFAAKRMFESIDSKQVNKIYAKNGGN